MGIKIPNNGEESKSVSDCIFPGREPVVGWFQLRFSVRKDFFKNIRLPIFVNFTTIIRNCFINYNNIGILFGIYFILVIFVSNLNIFVYEKTYIF